MAGTTTSKAFQKKLKKCLGALLSEYQQNAGLSQQDLIEKTRFGPKHMHLLMRGKVLPRLDTLPHRRLSQRLASAADLP